MECCVRAARTNRSTKLPRKEDDVGEGSGYVTLRRVGRKWMSYCEDHWKRRGHRHPQLKAKGGIEHHTSSMNSKAYRSLRPRPTPAPRPIRIPDIARTAPSTANMPNRNMVRWCRIDRRTWGVRDISSPTTACRMSIFRQNVSNKQ